MLVYPCEADGSSESDSKFLATPPVHERGRIPTGIAVPGLTNSGIMLQQCVPHTEKQASLSEEATAHNLGVLLPCFYTFSAECLLYT